MSIVVPVAVPSPALPVPDPSDRATFVQRKLEYLRWESQDLAPGAKALADAAYSNALHAESKANDATAQASAAAYQAATATAQAVAAAGSAASALTAPGTNATSSTSMTVGTGSKAFTLAQTGKSFVVGQWVTVSDSAAPAANWMLGAITAFNAGTGAITVGVVAAAGTLTGTSWVVAASAPVVMGVPVTTVAGATQTASAWNHYLMTNAAASTLTLPAAPAANDEVWVTFTNGLYTNVVGCNGKTIYGTAVDFAVNAGVLLTWKFKYLNGDWKTV